MGSEDQKALECSTGANAVDWVGLVPLGESQEPGMQGLVHRLALGLESC